MFVIRVFVLFFVFVFTAASCNSPIFNKKNDKVIAVVGDKELFLSQLNGDLPGSLNSVDSISFSQTYIERWVRNQLLLQKAELNLTNNTQDDIEGMVETYRISLMVFKYQQKLINQKLDTIVTSAQIAEYYKGNSGNFRLDSSVVKAIYVKVPKSTYDARKVRSWIRSNREDDIISLEDYCYQNAVHFSMGEQWEYFGELLNRTPRRIDDQDHFLNRNRNIEASDSLYKYYITILDYKPSMDTTPMVFVSQQIRDIIINRRKVRFIEDLENDVYRDAINQKKFTIYTN